MHKEVTKKLKLIPNNPGCYKFYNKAGDIIYIGKAKNLKKRINSYFGKPTIYRSDPKTRILVEKIENIKWEITESEIEALVLESLLIKKHKPKFNIKIKDDKDFLWVKIDSNEKFSYPEFVRRVNIGAIRRVARIKGRANGSPLQRINFFGPFTDSKLLKQGVAVLRKIFLWRDCSESKFNSYKKKGKPCLEYYIKNCSAPCSNFVNANDYQQGIKQLIMFLAGKKTGLIKGLERKMRKLAKEKKFEEAGVTRDKLRALENMEISLKIKNEKLKMKNYGVPSARYLKNIIRILNNELKYNIKFKRNFRIEFYDISNIAGKEAVGSMVVWQGGDFEKDQYRKFRIKTVKGISDTGMMREVLDRRIKPSSRAQAEGNYELRIINNYKNWPSPDLIILDGGKGQLGVIDKLFKENSVTTPLLSLAKKEEELFGMKNGGFKKINIIRNSPEGFFIQRLRDEAHRFAIGYHKKLREKKITISRLDEIPGIGPKTKKKLLLKFSSVDGIMETRLDELEKIVGEKLATIIKEGL